MTREYYANGFIKVAENNGYDPYRLALFGKHISAMEKNAKFGILSKLRTLLSPKVDPKKLNWFTRMFTDTKVSPTKLKGAAEDVGLALRKNYANHGMPVAPELLEGATGSIGGAVNTGASGGMPASDFAKKLTEWTYKDVEKTRINPLKVLAGLGAVGGGALGTSSIISGIKKFKEQEEIRRIKRNAAIAGLGALAVGGAGLLAYKS